MQITISADSLTEFISTIGELHRRLGAVSKSIPTAEMIEKGVEARVEQTRGHFQCDPTDPAVPTPAQIFAKGPVQNFGADPRPINPGVDVDSTGIPWDGRIHASSKALVAGNKWRTKRGVTDAQVATVQAELLTTWGTLPPISREEVVVTPPPLATGQDPFLVLMKGITAKFNDGSITMERVQDVLNPLGLNALPMLTKRPELIPQVASAFGVPL